MSTRGLTTPQLFYTFAGFLLVVALGVLIYLYVYTDKIRFSEKSPDTGITTERKQQILNQITEESVQSNGSSQSASASEKAKQLNQLSESSGSGTPNGGENIDEQTKLKILESLNSQ